MNEGGSTLVVNILIFGCSLWIVYGIYFLVREFLSLEMRLWMVTGIALIVILILLISDPLTIKNIRWKE